MVENHPYVSVQRTGAIATVVLDRPDALNALNSSILQEVGRLVSELANEGVRAIVLTGAGDRAFSAGADLDELAGLDSRCAYEKLASGHEVMNSIESCPVPVIAAVNGLALGGGFELILSCTFAVFAEKAWVGLPESGLGLIPGYGGTQRLAAIVGKPVAAHTMLTGERITAQRAYELGITPVPPVPTDQLMERVLEIAQTIASKGPAAQTSILNALGTKHPAPQDLELEAALAGVATGSQEAAEGIAAFQEKRPPNFTTYQGE